MPQWFKSYLEGLNNELLAELRMYLNSQALQDIDLYDELEQVLAMEVVRRKRLGI